MKQAIAVWITDTHLSDDTIEINKSIFAQVFVLCDQLNVKTIIHGGDIFTSRRGQTEAVLLAWKDIIDDAAEQNIKIIAIAGNHDKTNLNSDRSFLHVFDGHPGFKVMEAGDALLNSVVDLYFLPYYDEALTYPEKLAYVDGLVEEDKINILCTHVGVDEALTNGGVKLESEIKKDVFKKFNHVLIGHYHDRQILEGEKIIYTGSGYQANFGEDENKGVTVIYDDKEAFEFIQLEFRKYVTVDLLPADLDKQLVTQVTEKQTEANVRIRINGDVPDDKKHLLIDLQNVGAKVKIDKESFAPADIVQNKKLVMSNGDILSIFDEWTRERGIKSTMFGKKILQKML